MEKRSNSKVQGQLDFNAPLMSMRRITGSPLENETVDYKVDGTFDWGGQSTVYRSELKSGPLRNPGTVPFLWEQSPGKPKDEERVKATHDAPTPRAPRLPPGRTLTIKQAHTKSADLSSDRDVKNNEHGNRVSSNGFQQSNIHPNSDSTISANSDHAITSSIKGKSNGTVSNRPYSVIPFSQNHAYRDGLAMEDCDDFSDALETLSQTESCTVACSVSLVSGMEDQDHRSTSRFVDPQTRNFMIDRFLPAAKAMASESPQQTTRRPPVYDLTMPLSKGRENREPLPFQSRPYIVKREIKEEEDDEISGFSPKACGFFPWRFRNAFCHLNPVSHSARTKKKKPLSLLPAPNRGNAPRNLSDGDALSDSDDEDLTWEAIYRQKIVNGNKSNGFLRKGSDLKGFSANDSPEIGDGLMHRISYGSDSQTSNTFRTPTSGGISPYRNGAPLSPFSEGAGFLGFPKAGKEDNIPSLESRRSCNAISDIGTDDLCFWKKPSFLENTTRSGSVSPAIENALSVDTVHKVGPSRTNPGVFEYDEQVKGNKSTFDLREANSETKQGISVSETHLMGAMNLLEVGKESEVLKPKQFEPVEVSIVSANMKAEQLYCPEREICVHKDLDSREQNTVLVGNKSINDIPVMEGWPLRISTKCVELLSENKSLVPLNAKSENYVSSTGSPPPLSPPLPKSPSESWLWRAMPRTPSPNSRLSRLSGLRSPLGKQQQGSEASFADPKWETIVKSTYTQPGHLRFSEELNRQASPSSFRGSGPLA